MSADHTGQPRIYVACLAAYNSGILHGRWIDAAQDIDALWCDIRAMLSESPEPGAEEWAIHDYEGFGDIRLSEYEGIARVHAIAGFIGEHGSLGAHVLSYCAGDLEEAGSAMENYMGCYESLSDYAAELTEQSVSIPASLVHYIDYDKMAHDMEISGELFTVSTHWSEVHVFLSV